MYDIFFISSTKNEYFFKLKEKFPLIKHSTSFQLAQDRCLTEFFWIVWNDIIVNQDFNFDYVPDQYSKNYIHVFLNNNYYDGIVLCPKSALFSKKEIDFRFFINKKEVDIVASDPIKYDIFEIDSYDEYLSALETSTTEMFWMSSRNITANIPDVYFEHYNDYDRKQNHAFVHQVGDQKLYNGVFLCSKNKVLTKQEIEYRCPVERKEWDTVASGPVKYDMFLISPKKTNYFYKLKQKYPLIKHVTCFQEAQDRCLTEFFWIIWHDLIVVNGFNFDYVPDQWSKDFAHVFLTKLNNNYYDGIVLCPKSALFSKKEIDFRFFINKKEVDIVASIPIKYDIFEIDSYDEYLSALETSTTEMFWMSSRNLTAVIPDIYFQYSNICDRNQNHAFIHQVNDQKLYNGVFLCSKNKVLTKQEIEYRCPVERKEWEVVASGPVQYDHFYIETYDEYLSALKNSKTEMFWADSYNIKSALPDLYFTHDNKFDRTHNHNFLHSGSTRNGLFLLSKHALLTAREIEYRFIINAKEWNIHASEKISYPVYEIDSYEEYLSAIETSSTEMFWMTSRNITATIHDVYFDHHNDYDRKQTHAFVHQVGDQKLYNGVFLCSKHQPLTEREITHRHPVNRKEWDTVASGPVKYDVFEIDSYEEYLSALETSSTEMFWIIPDYVSAFTQFKFDTYFSHHQTYERTINHAYLNGKYHDGIILCSKYAKFSKREFDFRFIAHKIESPVIISIPKPYDVVFISYEEPNAEDNYNQLLKKIPTAKRIHGVKGIHQAHIAAAKLCSTDMVWIVDGDANVVDSFNFDYQVARWDQEIVHVWRSQNPINGLIYGYGGIKLFPTRLTINMDINKPDMTTSISSKFKAIDQISNITAFNTDPYNTWKSAFRECVKLSSRIIDRQKEDETQRRLQTWCTVGADRPNGKYALDGAKMGALYGARNQNNKEKLKMINNFEWLKEQFDARNT